MSWVSRLARGGDGYYYGLVIPAVPAVSNACSLYRTWTNLSDACTFELLFIL